jgi:hypothetical protein
LPHLALSASFSCFPTQWALAEITRLSLKLQIRTHIYNVEHFGDFKALVYMNKQIVVAIIYIFVAYLYHTRASVYAHQRVKSNYMIHLLL